MATKETENKLEKLIQAREYDTEWLKKYKAIVDGIHAIAEMCSESCNEDIAEWSNVESGLSILSRLLQEDIDGRKEETQN